MERFDQDIPVSHYLGRSDLNNRADLEELIENLIYDMKGGYFLMWEAVVRQEQGLPLTDRQEDVLSGLLSFDDEEEDEKILYIDERARPDEPWYQIVRKVVPHLLLQPFETYGTHYAVDEEGWPRLVECLEEHGRGLSLPDGLATPIDVVPVEMQHRLWLQSCFEALSGLGQMDELTLEEEDQLYRIPEFIEYLQAHKESVRFLDLSLEKLLAILVLPEKDREIFVRLMREELGLTSERNCIAAFLDNWSGSPPSISDSAGDMRDSAGDVTERLFEVDQRLPDELRDRILKMGTVCVPSLIEMLDQEDLHMTEAPGEGWAPIHAAELLGELRAEEAIPSLVNWLQAVDFEAILHGAVVHALGKIGEPAVAPLLQACRETDNREVRRSICDALSRTHGCDDAVFDVLMGQLDEDLQFGTILLAEYGDPRALPVLQQALDAYKIPDVESNVFAHQEVIELYAAIEELGGQPTPSQQAKYDRVQELRSVGRTLMERGWDVDKEPEQKPVKKEKKPGRNEPCWCGSGKKYKRCHWASDRSGGR